MKNLCKHLKKSILFKNKTIEELQKLISSVSYKIINFDKKDIILDSFSLTNSIGIVLSGELIVERILPSGNSVLLFHKSYGEMFGEVAVFSNADEYPCNVVALNKGSVILFTKDELFKILTIDNDILNNFLYLISSKAYYLNSKIESFSLPSARQKIIHSLLKDFNSSHNNQIIKLPFSKKLWSDSLNISRASLYRELNYLCDNNCIDISNSYYIKILDIDKLHSLLID